MALSPGRCDCSLPRYTYHCQKRKTGKGLKTICINPLISRCTEGSSDLLSSVYGRPRNDTAFLVPRPGHCL